MTIDELLSSVIFIWCRSWKLRVTIDTVKFLFMCNDPDKKRKIKGRGKKGKEGASSDQAQEKGKEDKVVLTNFLPPIVDLSEDPPLSNDPDLSEITVSVTD